MMACRGMEAYMGHSTAQHSTSTPQQEHSTGGRRLPDMLEQQAHVLLHALLSMHVVLHVLLEQQAHRSGASTDAAAP